MDGLVRVMFASHLMALRSGSVGSARDIFRYGQAARDSGHEVVVYGPPDPESPFDFSLDVESADALVFVFEWTTRLRDVDGMDFARLLAGVPRERRVVIDCDGSYNDSIAVHGDVNHRDEAAGRRWTEICDSLTDKICQPTLRPLRPNVRPFLFYGFDPECTVSYRTVPKEFGMVYVGHSKLRWAAMESVLRAVEPVRDHVGRLAVIGHGWDALPPWAAAMQMEAAFRTDPGYLRRLGVEVLPPIRFDGVISWMSRARFNPVLLRPLFRHFRLVTPRMFETISADTIPLFCMDAEHVRQIYGKDATELILPAEHPEDKILDVLRRPRYFIEILREVRQLLAHFHSHTRRFTELVEILEDRGRSRCN